MGKQDGAPDHLGPRLAAKPMHVFWLLDVSGSMAVDGKIDSLNHAMKEAVAAVREAVKENPGVQVMAHVITFAHGANWHIEDPVDIEELDWSAVEVVERGTTELGLAIELATEAIREVAAVGRGLPPALILVSDGKPTDLKAPSFGAALRELAEEPWGRKASRVAIGIGRDADMEALHRFIGHDEIEPIRAANAAELTHYLRWASTVVVDEKTRPAFGWDSVLSDPSHSEGRDDPWNPNLPEDLPKGQPRNLPPPDEDTGRFRRSDDALGQSAPTTNPDEGPTAPRQAEVEGLPTPPAPTTEHDEAPAVRAQTPVEESPTPPTPTTEPDEVPTVPPPPPVEPGGPARADIPPPTSKGAVEQDTVAEDPVAPTTDASEEATMPAAPETPPAPSPPQGAPRADLPPPPGLQPPPPPESSEDESPDW